jgi:hypothetical protein
VDPVRVKKTRQNKDLEPRFDSIETEKALAWSTPRNEKRLRRGDASVFGAVDAGRYFAASLPDF